MNKRSGTAAVVQPHPPTTASVLVSSSQQQQQRGGLATSIRFQQLQTASSEVLSVRLQARAKEAHAIEQVLRMLMSSTSVVQEVDGGSVKESEEDAIVIEELRTRLREVEGELLEHEPIIETDDPTELSQVPLSDNIDQFCRCLGNVLPRTFKLKDVLSKSSLHSTKLDTRHQDAKDIERDALIIGASSTGVGSPVTIFGSNIGYDGAVNAIAAEIADCCGLSSNSSAIVKFARVILNAANRTTSGGDAFEAMERFIRAPQLVFIAPDSNSPLDPLQITCRIGLFRTQINGWDWGVRARIEAVTKYLFYNVDDVDRLAPLARINGKCIREFGLSLPLPDFQDKRVFLDDGKSIASRAFFECDDGGILELSGNVMYSSDPAEARGGFKAVFDGLDS